MKASKIVFWGVVIVIGTAGLYLAYKKFFAIPDAKKLADELEAKSKQNPADTQLQKDAKEARVTADLSTAVKVDEFPLRRGSRGEFVRKMQAAMIKYYGNVLPIWGADGIFGHETEGAVKNNMGGDGKVTAIMYNTLLDAAARKK